MKLSFVSFVPGNLFFVLAFTYCFVYYVLNFNFLLKVLANTLVLNTLFLMLKKYFKYIFLYGLIFRIILLVSGVYSFYGDLLASLFILVYIFLSSTTVFSNVAKIISSNDYIKRTDVPYNLFLASFNLVLFLFFSVVGMILVLNFFSDGISRRSILFTFFSITCLTKLTGNILTKIGDVVADYKNKIEENIEEDKNTTVFDFLDNVGDIIGDMFSNFLDLFMLIILIMCCSNMCVHFDDYLYKSFGCIGKLFSFFAIISFIYSFVSYKFLFKIIDYIFILNAFFWILIDSFNRNAAIWNSKSFCLKSVIPDLAYLLFFSILLILFDLAKKLDFYKKSYKQNKEYYESIGSYCLFYTFAISMILACLCLFIMYLSSTITSLIYGSFNFSTIIMGSILWQNLFLFSCFYFWKSCIGILADSVSGFLNKVKIENESYGSKHNDFTETENILEDHDRYGNICKLESRVFLCSVFFVSVISNIKTYGFILAVYGIVFVVTIIFINLWKQFINTKDVTYNLLFNKISRVSFYFMSIFIIVLVKIVLQSKLNKIWLENVIAVSYGALYISLASCIFGSLLDIYKKYSNDDKVSNELKKAFIKHDICGDFMKDVLSPTMYTVSILSLYAILCV